MRIAVLMHGIVGNADKFGTGTQMDCEISHKHFVKHILEKNENVDVFMHSWSVDAEEKLTELYSPKKKIIEKQKIFDFEYTVGNPETKGKRIRADFGNHNGKFKGLENLRFHSMFSRWYSAKMANELKKEYEKENNFKYDFVMLTRYDLAYVVDFEFNKFPKDKFLVIGPDGHQHGINDLWFISSSEKMDLFSKMFKYVSSINHFPHKFIHSHFLSKQFLIETGMINDIVFVGPERPWEMGPEGEKLGPSPLVRHHYNLQEYTSNDYMNKVRTGILELHGMENDFTES